MKKIAVLVIYLIVSGVAFGQENPFENMDFVIGDWKGIRSNSQKSTSKIESSFQFMKEGKQIDVSDRCRLGVCSAFQIKYDTERQLIVCDRIVMLDPDFSEGYTINFFLDHSLSSDTSLVFRSEQIKNLPDFKENPVIEKARWTIKKVSENEYKDSFEICYSGKESKCLWTSRLVRKE